MILVVSLYVDDLLITGSSAKLIDEFKLDMMQVFEMIDLGLMTYFLGMEIKQGKDQVFICQRKYAKGDSQEVQNGRLQKNEYSHEPKKKAKQR